MTEPSPQTPPAPPPPVPPTATGPSGPRSSFGRRLVAYILDGIIVGIAFGILVGIGAAIGDSLLAIAYVIGTAGSIAYPVYFEGSPSGQTPGKKALGIRVIDFNTGGPIGYGRAFVRWIGKLVSAIPCYLGYLWMLWDREKQTWADKFASSVVVPESAYPVTSWPG
jgi:uncharacterized RDD family membrane protein YckC